MKHNISFFYLCVILAATNVSAQNYDLLIRGGRVVDGAGNPAFFADVAVKNGRIVAIGKLTGDAKTLVDARGLVVTPGFIDVHTHAEDVLKQPLAENYVRMGVTTVVVGNCGGSKRDVAEFLRQIQQTNIAINVATLIGHNTVRIKAMGGSFDRAPTDEQLAQMKLLVEQAMKDGAVGLSTGLIYLPGTFAKTDEIITLAKVVAAYDGIYVSHIRNESTRIYEALDELFRIAREAGIRAHISHIKLTGKSMWGQTAKVLGAIERARADGLDITQDQYVYPASSTGISRLIPESAREGDSRKFADRLADPQQKAQIVAEMKKSLKRQGFKNYAYVMIASYAHAPSLNGLNLIEATRKTRGKDSLGEQIEMILDIHKNGGASAVFHGMNEDDLQKYLVHPNTMVASDSSVADFQKGVPHPRGYGNNARVLGRYVRELKLLRLEDAIRRMTTLPAATFMMKDRGQLREGAYADLVVFDPATVQDNATFPDPHHYATGFKRVFVNGVAVIEDDKHTGARPGQPVRPVTNSF
ncbi:MAG: D-aminoacylase [Kiritimatiellae bacterium]|nr:D-aminoacylase [Kiritimatiellia bacterium]MDD5522292.1 D-aminoacylase [Kiritimatiellia bacterium]